MLPWMPTPLRGWRSWDHYLRFFHNAIMDVGAVFILANKERRVAMASGPSHRPHGRTM